MIGLRFYLTLALLAGLVAGGCGLYAKGRLDQKKRDDRAALLARVTALQKQIADTNAVAEGWKASQAEKARAVASLEEQIHDMADALSKHPDPVACDWTGDELERLRALGHRVAPAPARRPFDLRGAGHTP